MRLLRAIRGWQDWPQLDVQRLAYLDVAQQHDRLRLKVDRSDYWLEISVGVAEEHQLRRRLFVLGLRAEVR